MESFDTGNRFLASFDDDDRPEIEYRSVDDDAWYSVELVLLHDVLVVRYKDFPSEYDEVFPASEYFSSSGEIESFAARFRTAFVQMQDPACATVAKGTEVCALFRFDTGDVKFYDAIVVQVDRAKHGYTDKGEVCCCSFLLSWKIGPLVGKLTWAKIDEICLHSKDNRVDPILLLFLKKAMDQFQVHAHNVLESSGSGGSAKHRPSSHAKAALLNPGTSPPKYDQMKNKDPLMSKLSDAPQQQLPTNHLNFYLVQRARRKGKFAVKTTEGRLHGFCKKI